jgi:hypothetical protein
MKPEFLVKVVRFKELIEIAGVWGDVDFVKILNLLEYGDTTGLEGQELRDMCLLSLQDLSPEEAAELILRLHLGNRLSNGQIQNMAREMRDEKLWEEYADLSLHERLFHVGSLLHETFPREFPRPDAACVTLHIQAMNELSRDILAHDANESFFVRLIADGIDPTSALCRVFDEQLASRSFPEAEQIVWTSTVSEQSSESVTVELIGSGAWFAALSATRSYSSHAYPDE